MRAWRALAKSSPCGRARSACRCAWISRGRKELMPIAGRRRKRLVAAAILALAGIALHAAAEADSTTLPATPAAGEVTIYRDDWGVPHIYARREADGYFGLGYAQAQDQVGFIL